MGYRSKYPGAQIDALLDTVKQIDSDFELTKISVQELETKVDIFFQDADKSAQAIDTLKELLEYINSDETGTSQMLEEIQRNTATIAAATSSFSDLGMSENSGTDGYEIGLVKKTNAQNNKISVKIPIFDTLNPQINPIGLVDEIFVEDMHLMVDDKIESALKDFTPENGADTVTVIDNLTTDLSDAALSAKQGKELKRQLDEEIARAKGKESTLDDAILTNSTLATNIELALLGEVSRAQDAEAVLDVRITAIDNAVGDWVSNDYGNTVTDNLNNINAALSDLGSAAIKDVDDVPTTNSNNLVTSGGVYQAIGDVTEDMGLMMDDKIQSALGSSVNVVQGTGSSTTDVMSQKAVTDTFNEINDEVDNVTGLAESAINNLGTGSYPVFSTENNYSEGDIVRSGVLLYKFTADYVSGESYFDETAEVVTVVPKLKEIEEKVEQNTSNIPRTDDVDITRTSTNHLRLADRAYSSENPDGLGYMILRKNETFANQINGKTNTIFEVRYDFEISSNDVIGEGCRLLFNGGSIIVDGVKIEESIVYAKEVGMIPNINNDTVASKNVEKIAASQNLGLKLIIDDVYYIKGNATWLNHCDIEGTTKEKAHLIVASLPTASTNVFQLNAETIGYVRVKNLSVSTLTDKGHLMYNILFALLAQAPNLRSIEFSNIIDDGLRLFSITSYDVDMTNWHIDKAHINNVYATNIDMLYNTPNVPYREFVCENCTIINCYRQAFNLAETNDYVNKSSMYFDNVVFRNNHMENTFVGDYEVSSLSLVVLEAQICHYYNNVIKNLVNTNSESVVYDAYLSCRELYYHDNVVENICSQSASYRDIYKCKMNAAGEGTAIRHICNNSYHLTEQFFKDNDINETYTWGNSIGTLEEVFNEFVFAENTIVAEFGCISFGNFARAENVVISRNYIKGRIVATWGTALAFLPSVELVITGNTIISNNITGDVCCKLLRGINNNGCHVVYKDNYIKNVGPMLYETALTLDDYTAFLGGIDSSDNTLYLDYVDSKIYYMGDNSRIVVKEIIPTINLYECKNVEIVGQITIYAMTNALVNSEGITKVSYTFDSEKVASFEIENDTTYIYTNYAKHSNLESYAHLYIDYAIGESIQAKSPDVMLIKNTVVSCDVNPSNSYRYRITPVVCSTTYRNIIGKYSSIATANTNKLPMLIDTDLGVPVVFVNERWVNSDGYVAGKRSGATSVRTSLAVTENDAGLQFLDITLGKVVVYDGTAWVNLDGTALS